MLKQVSFELGQRKLVRGIGEINRPVRCYIEIIRTMKRNSVGLGTQHGALSVRGDRHQPNHRVSDNQVSAMIEHQPERTALRLRKNFGLCTISLKTKEAAVVGAAIDPILTVEGDIFRPEAFNLQSFNFAEL